jgi:hemerythrin-like domain-containing protein
MKPTEILMEEHRVIERVLTALEKAASRLSRGEDVYLRFFSGTTALISGFADSYHYKKEEKVLYPALVENGLPKDTGPVAMMLAEHEEGRRLAQRLRQVTERFQAGDVKVRDQVVLSAMGYVSLLRRHMDKEDKVLFPLVANVIPVDRQAQIIEAFERFEREENGAELHEKYYGMAERLVRECVR